VNILIELHLSMFSLMFVAFPPRARVMMLISIFLITMVFCTWKLRLFGKWAVGARHS